MDAPLTLAELLPKAGSITVLTGAGISTDSGIPDFRGPQGVWTKDPAAEAMSTIGAYLADPEVRRRAWRARRDNPVWEAEPNAAHTALAELERAGRLRALITQNIDGLHQRAGSSGEKVIEIHGTMRDAVCLSCGLRTPMPDILARVDAGEDDPPCLECGDIQKSATISFGQALDQHVLDAAIAAARSCDLFLAVGTSLTVQPAAGLCLEAVDRGARLVIINAEETPYDGVADAVLRRPIGETLPRLAGLALGTGR
ncbi:SIR2 family NAD-dependent protein deacylase [Actinomadura madurae]|uniref:SIR2 family NAD-dependent protein deacylase n=1 Tax=Actinomadura madurae TaxID=1993 RepID=UPI0020D23BC1|nr:NAD-dependent deacylase [Actinomadura madurae]MCP9947896.1 NAD-dependent deacylase [Actinomadura madurae]MCP9964670.1 NAD-dependent deacylase [Actinomadura madurae]MCQ0011344.1 NAD-dependent deacylase [Actinomadura madurae]MCQ0013341.1 NAD-dependent deacylase [Actinomadura madurae]